MFNLILSDIVLSDGMAGAIGAALSAAFLAIWKLLNNFWNKLNEVQETALQSAKEDNKIILSSLNDVTDALRELTTEIQDNKE